MLPRESEILHLKFWAAAFELLKERKAIYFETEGKNKGCWVMPATAFPNRYGRGRRQGDRALERHGHVRREGHRLSALEVRAAGQGFLLPAVARRYPDGRVLWVIDGSAQPQSGIPQFGHGTRVYNVIDSRQSYLQDVVVAGLRALGYDEQAERSIHFSYEMVALSPRCCAELGIELSEEDTQAAVRRGVGPQGAGRKGRRPDGQADREGAGRGGLAARRRAPEEERRGVATQIAIGALRYFLLKFTRNSVIAFDLQEALSFEGETGPYVQYAAVRARNILRKLEERGEQLPDFKAALNEEAMKRQLTSEDFWQLLLAGSRAGLAIERAVTSGEPSHVARYAFQLAQSFNTFYHDYPVLAEQDEEKRTFLLWMTSYFRSQLDKTLQVLGIEAPSYM